MASKIHSQIRSADVRPYQMRALQDSSDIAAEAIRNLSRIGIHIDANIVRKQVGALMSGGDADFVPMVTTASIPTPLQFLQGWLPGFVKTLTAARKIDKLVGVATVGSWHDQEIVQGVVEPLGVATEYGDLTNVPLASYNANFERRTVVRGEMGFQVARLEEERAAEMKLNSADTKRTGAGIQLEQFRNAVGFFGWNGGNNRTFGFLNDPNLPAYKAVSKKWNTATFLEICSDLRTAIAELRTQSEDNIDPESVKMKLCIATDTVDRLSTVSDYGVSVRDWLTQTYKNIEIESAPELNGASADASVFYLYAETVDSSVDGSTDGGDTFIQMVPAKFFTLGVEQRAKSYVEDFSNATAGVMCKRPYAVVRFKGIN